MGTENGIMHSAIAVYVGNHRSIFLASLAFFPHSLNSDNYVVLSLRTAFTFASIMFC